MSLYNRTTLVNHGIDLAGTWANRPQNPGHGFCYYVEDLQKIFVFDSPRYSWFAIDGDTIYDAATNYLSDLFRGPALDSQYPASLSGSDGAAADPVITAAAEGGVVVGVTGAGAAADYAANGSQLSPAAVYATVSDGPTIFTSRFKISAITNVAYYLGTTDVVEFEEPASLATATFTTNMTDGCGFLFDTAATEKKIWCVGVATNTDVAHVNTGLAPVADTFREYAIELDAAGQAKFYIDEVLVATIADCAATTAILAPVLCSTARAAASRTWTAKSLSCHQDG